MPILAPLATPAAPWEAELDLRFSPSAAGTVLAGNRHRGPLVVQKPFFPEGRDLCHVYLLHPPGGIVGGDRLAVNATLDAHSQGLLTTPAATKIYRSLGATARVNQRLAVGSGASCEWLPQETILFDGACVDLHTRIDLAPDATCLAWEILCLGRPTVGERFVSGRCRQRFEIWRGQRPLYLERGRFDGGSPVHAAAWGLRHAPVTGTLVASAPQSLPVIAELPALAQAMPSEDLASVTTLQGALIARYLGASAPRARAFFESLWSHLRPHMLNRPALAPRVWAT